MTWRAVAVGVLAIIPCAPAGAHDRSISYSTWDIRGRQARVTVRLAELDLTRFPWAATADAPRDRAVGRYLTEKLHLRTAAQACAVTDGPRRLQGAIGHAVMEWRLTCPGEDSLAITSELLLDVAPSHLHVARVRVDGAPALERVFSAHERHWALPAAADASPLQGTSLLGYLHLGVEHIVTGYDHLAFVFALLLLGSSLGAVAKVVTGFTVAHSLTLALAVLGVLRPERTAIEALIGLSIALVAAENVWLQTPRGRALPGLVTGLLAALAAGAAAGYGQVPARTLAGLALFAACYFGLLARLARADALRWAIAFLFGLVHGFGFAGVLLEAELPSERLVLALFGFNAGVELGQLGAVVLAWPLLRAATRARGGRWRSAVIEAGSAAVLAVGVFWFVTRAYG
jgi:hypothetical protein